MAKVWNLKAVVLTVSGGRIQGYGETDAIGFEWLADTKDRFVSADGESVFMPTNDKALACTITLHQRSPSYPFLQELQQTQDGDRTGIAPSVIVPLPFLLVDPATGERIFSLDTVFMNRPAPSKNKRAAEVAFRVILPKPDIGRAILNLIG